MNIHDAFLSFQPLAVLAMDIHRLGLKTDGNQKIEVGKCMNIPPNNHTGPDEKKNLPRWSYLIEMPSVSIVSPSVKLEGSWKKIVYSQLSIIRHSLSAIKIITTHFHYSTALDSPPCLTIRHPLLSINICLVQMVADNGELTRSSVDGVKHWKQRETSQNHYQLQLFPDILLRTGYIFSSKCCFSNYPQLPQLIN